MAKWNVDETPDFPVVPDDIYRLAVEEAQAFGGTDEVQLRIQVSSRVEEPSNWRGFPVRRTFFLGTKEDPRAELPATRLSRDWVAYKNFLKACEIAPIGDTDEEIETLNTGTPQFLGRTGVRQRKNKDGSKSPENTIYAFYRLGTKDVGTNQGRANGLDATPTAPQAKPAGFRALDADE